LARKRKRNSTTTDQTMIYFLNLMKIYMVFQRTMTCPWYIRPRAIQWTRLFLDFVPSDRFQNFFE
jgi:hypothetical protein